VTAVDPSDLIAEARKWIAGEACSFVGPNRTTELVEAFIVALESQLAENTELRAVIEQAMRVEDHNLDKGFMWQVGKMRGILEQALASVVPVSPEGLTE
jgi:hypothetical protein